jgi:probable HAF family extracellular repeat protein
MKPLASLSLAAGALLSACHNLTEPPRPTLALSLGASAPMITTTAIGPLGPGVPGQCLFPPSAAIDVNDRGLVVGSGASGDESLTLCTFHGFKWDKGTLTNLGAIAPVAVNNHDQIAGNTIVVGFGPTHGALLQDSALTDLGTLGGEMSRVSALNNRGQIVGFSTTATGDTHGFLWDPGTMTDLGTLGGPSSQAIAVNEHGQVAGNSVTAGGATHGFLWQDGMMIDLGTLGGTTSEVRAMNARGQVVGRSATAAGERHAFLWDRGVMTDLGTLGGTESDAHAVNQHGQIAGISSTGNGFVTDIFLWQDGTMTDLGTPQPQGTPFGLLKINDRGQIVGTIAFAGSLRAGLCWLWQNGTVTQLPTALAGEAVALNKSGQIVGWDLFPFSFVMRAVLWTVERGGTQVASAQPGEGPDSRAAQSDRAAEYPPRAP